MSFTESIEQLVHENRNGLLGRHPAWERVQLRDVASVLNGFAFSSSYFTKDEGKPLLRIRDILEDHTETKYSGEFDPVYLAKAGDLLIGMDGDFNCALWRGPEALLNQRVCKLTVHEEFYNKKLMAYTLPGYLKAINDATSSITVKHLSSRTVEEIPLPLPSRPQQDRIVAEIEKQFTRLDDAVGALERVQANLKRYRASVLRAACEGRLVPSEAELARKEGRDYERASELLNRLLAERRAKWEANQLQKLIGAGNPPENDEWKKKFTPPAAPKASTLSSLPVGWAWATVDQITGLGLNAITDGPFGSNLKTEHYTQRGPRVIRLQNIGDAEFIDSEAHISFRHFKQLKRHAVTLGDVVIAALGDPAPRACLIPEIGDAIVKADCIKLTTAEGIIPSYVSFALNSEGVRKRTTARIHGVGRPRLNLTEIKEIVLPIPPTAEQRLIASAVERQFSIQLSVLRSAQGMLAKASALRTAVLKRGFEGKLVSQDPNQEPATELLKRITAEKASRRPDRHTRRRKADYMKKEKERKPKTLLEVLKAHKSGMSPERLLAVTGHGPETIDDFYAELKVDIDAGRIMESRAGTRIALRAR